MDSDEINSVSDTTESQQVVSIIKDTYFNLLNTIDVIPEHRQLLPLTALSDATHPNYFLVPTNVTRFEWIKYNVSQDSLQEYRTIHYKTVADFLENIMSRNSDDDNIDTITDFGNVPLLIMNDKMPQFWTSFDDDYIVFDSYHSDYDSTLQASKSLAYAQVEPTWTTTDTFIPDLDSNLFPLLLADAKSMCFASLRQTANPIVERTARRQMTSTQNNKNKLKSRYAYPDFGRK